MASIARQQVCRQLRALAAGEQQGPPPLSWRAEVRPSSAPCGGEGVFLSGSCQQATVVAVYPGVSYQAADLRLMHQIVLKGNEYVLARRDGVLIDARPHGASAQIFEVALRRDTVAHLSTSPGAEEGSAPAVSCASGQRVSQDAPCLLGSLPFSSIGHKVNHPPSGQLPNVFVYPLDLFEEESDLFPYIHTYPFRPPARGEPLKQTAVLVRHYATARVTFASVNFDGLHLPKHRSQAVRYAMRSYGWITS